MSSIFDGDFDPNDFVIRLRPRMADGVWDGDVDIGIMWDGKHELVADDFHKLMHLTKMVCASVPIMEYDEELRNDINNFVLETENDTCSYRRWVQVLLTGYCNEVSMEV